ESENPHTILTPPGGVREPNVVCIPRTNVAESADVMKNTETSTMATMESSAPIGSSLNIAKSCVSGAMSKIPGVSGPTVMPVMPNTLNQMMLTTVGTKSTAPTNSRILRPREIMTMKMPTNVLQLIHQPQ